MDTFLWELEMLQVDARRTELIVFLCVRGLEAFEAFQKLPMKKIIRQCKEEYEIMKDDVVVADDEEAHPKNDEEDDNESKHTEEHVATVADHTPDQEDEPVDN
ncbi:unnamed protein product [Aphanomyces euteiches]